MTDNFADAPVSLAEHRADANWSGMDWTARDMLIQLLRSIDRGEIKIGGCIVAFQQLDEDGTHASSHFRAAQTTLPLALGLLARASHLLNTST